MTPAMTTSLAVGDRVDVDLDRVAQILVDQHRAVAGDLDRGVDVIVELDRSSTISIARPPST
jgi:hypothetical protein